MGLFLVKHVKILKIAIFRYTPSFIALLLSARECLNFLKICQITNFDISFQKITLEVETKKSIFERSVFSRATT